MIVLTGFQKLPDRGVFGDIEGKWGKFWGPQTRLRWNGRNRSTHHPGGTGHPMSYWRSWRTVNMPKSRG